MQYVTEYEICALLFLLIVTFRFFRMRKFRNRSNRLFGAILYIAIVDIVLDLVGSVLIVNADTVPVALNYTVNTAFYMLQVFLPALMLVYVAVLSGKEIRKIAYVALIPFAATELLLLINPFTKLVFYLERTAEGMQYLHGSVFIALYISSAFYLLLTAATVLCFRRFYRRFERRMIVSFVGILILAVAIQIAYPKYLLTGTGMSIAVFMMFLTMQNPETMLDSITGTFNFSALTEFLRGKISEGRKMWITAVDVGGIRRINSLMGIRSGNELLEQIGEFTNGICSNRATAFRMIGTRFIIISDQSQIHMRIVDQLTERFRSPWRNGVMLLATVRYCGEAFDFSAPEDVINLVDLAYSKTAEEGFGSTKQIDSKQLEQFRRKGQIKEAMERAIAKGTGFYLNYQPLFSVKDMRFCGAEALLRFKDSKLGQVSPAEFIPVAENSDLIYQIDSMVIRMACEFVKTHPELFDAGLRLLEINLSASEFNNDTGKLFDDIVRDITGIEGKICFEVTETAVTLRREILSDFMHRLIEKGVRFAIDDFGTGYANITQLAKLPFSIVKLDRIFVSQNDGKEATILCDLVKMFDHIGLSTVFEGIETAEQAEFASALGVDQIQGFFYSRPLSENDLIALMASGTEPMASAKPLIV